MKYTWRCGHCGITVEHVSASENQYLVGFEIHSEHKQRSSLCTNMALEIFQGDAQSLIQSKAFQDEIKRIESLAGVVEVRGNVVTLYCGAMPHRTITLFAERLRKLDFLPFLNIIVSTKDRP